VELIDVVLRRSFLLFSLRQSLLRRTSWRRSSGSGSSRPCPGTASLEWTGGCRGRSRRIVGASRT
jgi:hypothetical protein